MSSRPYKQKQWFFVGFKGPPKHYSQGIRILVILLHNFSYQHIKGSLGTMQISYPSAQLYITSKL